MRCGYSESEHKGSVATFEKSEIIEAHRANTLLTAEDIFSKMLALQESGSNSAWAEARSVWFHSDFKLMKTPPAKRMEALKLLQIMQPLSSSSGPVSEETALQVQKMLNHFESKHSFGIAVTVTPCLNTVLENVFEVTMTEPAVTAEQLLKAFVE